MSMVSTADVAPRLAPTAPAGVRGGRLPGAGATGSCAAAVGAGDGLGAVDESSGEVGQALVAVAGLVPQQRERLVDVDAQPLGEFALGLLDDDPAVQRGLQLLVEGIAVAHAALMQQADGGHVGQRLANLDAVCVEGTWGGAEKVERADDLVAQPHRQGLHGGEAGLSGGGGELGPALVSTQVGGCDGVPGAEAVQAGPLVALQLEQLKQPGGLAGGGHHTQFSARIGQQQPGGGNVQQLGAAGGQHVQEVDDVEVGDHGVGKLDKGLRQQLSVHLLTLSTKSARSGADRNGVPQTSASASRLVT